MPKEFYLNIKPRELKGGKPKPALKIPLANAIKYHEEYLKNPHYCIKLPPPQQPGGKQKYWKGYRISKNDILNLLCSDGENVTDLFVFLAINPDDVINGKPAKEQRVTMVFSRIIPDAKNPDGQIDPNFTCYEYVDPCPDRCPTQLKP